MGILHRPGLLIADEPTSFPRRHHSGGNSGAVLRAEPEARQ